MSLVLLLTEPGEGMHRWLRRGSAAHLRGRGPNGLQELTRDVEVLALAHKAEAEEVDFDLLGDGLDDLSQHWDPPQFSTGWGIGRNMGCTITNTGASRRDRVIGQSIPTASNEGNAHAL